jgi:hypothetical protein
VLSFFILLINNPFQIRGHQRNNRNNIPTLIHGVLSMSCSDVTKYIQFVAMRYCSGNSASR